MTQNEMINHIMPLQELPSPAPSVFYTKTCSKCKQTKPKTDFRKQSSTKDGLKYMCRECDDAAAKAKYESNKAKRLAQVRAWQASHPEKVREYVHKFRVGKKGV